MLAVSPGSTDSRQLKNPTTDRVRACGPRLQYAIAPDPPRTRSRSRSKSKSYRPSSEGLIDTTNMRGQSFKPTVNPVAVKTTDALEALVPAVKQLSAEQKKVDSRIKMVVDGVNWIRQLAGE